MKRLRFGAFIFGVLSLAAMPVSRADTPAPVTTARSYLYYVETFADTLLEKGRDTYGPRKTPVWAAVIDTRDLSVPRDGVPEPPGVRAGDRAVGGSNLLHDVATIRALTILSDVTKKPRYRDASREYLQAFLIGAQSSETGLLAWGEHTYYDLFRDEGSVYEKYRDQSYGGMWHELLAWTPPWEALWAIDAPRTEKAIRGLEYHFFGPDAKSPLFNRHAHWEKAAYQEAKGAQPWIKHAGLYTHAFMTLYSRTRSPTVLARARDISSLYWDARNPRTNLTEGCIGDPRPTSHHAGLGGTASLAYWMVKGYQASPDQRWLRDRALTLLKAYNRYGYDTEAGAYYGSLTTEGKPVGDVLKTWWAGYGEGSVLKFGRMAAYIARTEKAADCLTMARRAALCARRDPMPESYVVEPIANALNLSLDLYDLTGKSEYLADARRYADIGITKFWSNGLFVRQTGDPYYEAKLGIGDLVSGLLRLHLRSTGKGVEKDSATYDWSL